MTADRALLTLMQWLSPSFPTGGFAYSHGMESAVADGLIDGEADVQDWIGDLVARGSLRADAIWVSLAWRAGARDAVVTLDTHARAFVAASERLREGVRQGAAFVETANAVWGLDVPHLMLPVAVGRAARLGGLPHELTVAAFLQSSVANLAAAMVRLIPLGQTEGQRIVAALAPACIAMAAEAVTATPDDIHSTTFASDIAAMRHETLQPRIFQS